MNGYQRVVERMSEAAARCGRDVSEIALVVVSKGRSVDQILEVYEAGHRDFGENRAGEMAEKVGELPGDIRWHYVGNLQSRKARLVRGSTHVLHSLDRISLARAWVKGKGNPPPALAQVNIGREEQKGGADPDTTAQVIEETLSLGIEVRGLMAIPPLGDEPEDSRRYFSSLRRLRDELVADGLVLPELSMGMTNDFEVAIEEGASIIRVGRAIFDRTLA